MGAVKAVKRNKAGPACVCALKTCGVTGRSRVEKEGAALFWCQSLASRSGKFSSSLDPPSLLQGLLPTIQLVNIS